MSCTVSAIILTRASVPPLQLGSSVGAEVSSVVVIRGVGPGLGVQLGVPRLHAGADAPLLRVLELQRLPDPGGGAAGHAGLPLPGLLDR